MWGLGGRTDHFFNILDNANLEDLVDKARQSPQTNTKELIKTWIGDRDKPGDSVKRLVNNKLLQEDLIKKYNGIATMRVLSPMAKFGEQMDLILVPGD